MALRRVIKGVMPSSFHQVGCLVPAFMGILQGSTVLCLGKGPPLVVGLHLAADLHPAVDHLLGGALLPAVPDLHLGVGAPHLVAEGQFLGVGGLCLAVDLILGGAILHLGAAALTQEGAAQSPGAADRTPGAEDLLQDTALAHITDIHVITGQGLREGGRRHQDGKKETATSRMIRRTLQSKISRNRLLLELGKKCHRSLGSLGMRKPRK